MARLVSEVAAAIGELHDSCSFDPSYVIVSIVTNSAADWSFGYGRVQFITGE